MDLMALVKAKKKELNERSGRREKTVKPQNGKSRWRILPRWDGNHDGKFWQEWGQHFVKRPYPDAEGKTLAAVYMCSQETFGTPCAICDGIKEAMSQLKVAGAEDEVIKALNESRASRSILVNALHIDGPEPTSPVILELRPTVFEKITDIMTEYGDSLGLMVDPANGFDVVITREGRGLNTRYDVMYAPGSKPVPASSLTQAHDLEAYVDQEWEEGKQKALEALGEAANGLLTHGLSSDRFARSAPAAALPPAAAVAPAVTSAAVVEQVEAEPQQQPPTSPPAAVAEVATEAFATSSVSDEDMEALLADL